MSYSKEVWDLNRDQLEAAGPVVPASKYKNARAQARGMTFQSGHEATVVAHLLLLEDYKKIYGLRLQVRFALPGKTVYVADAVYLELRDGKLVVVVADAKGYETPVWKIKRKLFKERYGVDITIL